MNRFEIEPVSETRLNRFLNKIVNFSLGSILKKTG